MSNSQTAMYGLDVLPLWVIFLAQLVLGWIVLEAGYRLGRWRHALSSDEKDAPVSAMVAAILGTRGVHARVHVWPSRWDAQRQTVLEEANAIGTFGRVCCPSPPPQSGRPSCSQGMSMCSARGTGKSILLLGSLNRSSRVNLAASRRRRRQRSRLNHDWPVRAISQRHDRRPCEAIAHRLVRGAAFRSRFGSACSRFHAQGNLCDGLSGRPVGYAYTPAMMASRRFRRRIVLIVSLDRGHEDFLTVDSRHDRPTARYAHRPVAMTNRTRPARFGPSAAATVSLG